MSLYVAQVIQYFGEVNTAITRLEATGCADMQVSLFTGTADSPDENPNAPEDRSCHVFDVAGAGITRQTPPPQILQRNPPMGNDWYSGYWIAPYNLDADAGECEDTVIELWDVTQDFCIAFNRAVENNWTTIPNTIGHGSHVDYSYACGIPAMDETGHSGDGRLAGKTAFCYYDPGGPFYAVLYLIQRNPGH